MMPVRRKVSIGRISKYKPEYCEVVELWGKQGKSRMQIASLLNIDRKTLNQWEADFPDFGQALSRAMVHSQAWWEGHAQKNLRAKHYQAQLWRANMMGRFKEDYAERPQATAGELVDFLSAVVDAAGERQAKKLPASDAAKPIAVDVTLTKRSTD